MKKQNITKVTCRSGLAFERFFDERRRQLRAQGGSSYVYYEIIGQIENWTALQIRTIPKGSSVKPDNFLATITYELSNIYEKLKSPIDAFEVKKISPKVKIESQVTMQTRGRARIEDMAHLASAIEYQFVNNIWIVFVTFDEDHILSNKESLWEVCALRCSKPAYAHDHRIALSRMKKPIQYYLCISEHKPQQLSFAKDIETALNLKITS